MCSKKLCDLIDPRAWYTSNNMFCNTHILSDTRDLEYEFVWRDDQDAKMASIALPEHDDHNHDVVESFWIRADMENDMGTHGYPESSPEADLIRWTLPNHLIETHTIHDGSMFVTYIRPCGVFRYNAPREKSGPTLGIRIGASFWKAFCSLPNPRRQEFVFQSARQPANRSDILR